MITQIGLVAGDIWNYLEKHERKVQIQDLCKSIDYDKDLILMSLGWLAREGHILLEGNSGEYKVSLT